MSHTSTLILGKVNSKEIFKRVAKRMGYRVEKNVKVKLYSSTHTGLAVYLPGWKYPVVVDNEGKVHYDNWGGKWGKRKYLENFLKEVKEETEREKRRKKEEKVNLILQKARERGDRVIEVRERKGVTEIYIVTG